MHFVYLHNVMSMAVKFTCKHQHYMHVKRNIKFFPSLTAHSSSCCSYLLICCSCAVCYSCCICSNSSSSSCWHMSSYCTVLFPVRSMQCYLTSQFYYKPVSGTWHGQGFLVQAVIVAPVDKLWSLPMTSKCHAVVVVVLIIVVVVVIVIVIV